MYMGLVKKMENTKPNVNMGDGYYKIQLSSSVVDSKPVPYCSEGGLDSWNSKRDSCSVHFFSHKLVQIFNQCIWL